MSLSLVDGRDGGKNGVFGNHENFTALYKSNEPIIIVMITDNDGRLYRL